MYTTCPSKYTHTTYTLIGQLLLKCVLEKNCLQQALKRERLSHFLKSNGNLFHRCVVATENAPPPGGLSELITLFIPCFESS